MIKKANMNWSVKTLCNQMAKGVIDFACAIQRGFAWDIGRKCHLIHSAIEGYPIPALYLVKNGNGYDCLDGKQRSHALWGFVSNEYPLDDDFIVTDEDGAEHNFSGMSFDELPGWAQDNIKDFSLTIYYFEDLTEEQYVNLFFKLNNGKPLTAVELTRVKAQSLPLLQEIARHDIVSFAVTEKGKIKYNHENLAMQVWAACFYGSDDLAFETKVFRGIIESAEVTPEQVSEINNIFNTILNMYYEFDQGDKAQKRIAKKFVTRTHLVALTRAVMVGLEKDYEFVHLLAWAKLFFSASRGASIDGGYNLSCGSGSGSRNNVHTRMNIIVSNMDSYMTRVG